MDSFELYGTVDAIVCVLDSLNYLLDPAALDETFRLCANYLNPNGLLIFDVNSEYKFSSVLANETYTYETDDIFYIWENEYNPESRLCDLYLTFFCQESNGLYHRVDEVHTQRVYSDDELQRALQKAGLTTTAKYDGYTHNAPTAKSHRIVYEVKKL